MLPYEWNMQACKDSENSKPFGVMAVTLQLLNSLEMLTGNLESDRSSESFAATSLQRPPKLMGALQNQLPLDQALLPSCWQRVVRNKTPHSQRGSAYKKHTVFCVCECV